MNKLSQFVMNVQGKENLIELENAKIFERNWEYSESTVRAYGVLGGKRVVLAVYNNA